MTRYCPLSLPLALVGTLLTSASLSPRVFAQPVVPASAALAPGLTPEFAPEFESVWDFFRREAEDRRAGRSGSPRIPGQCEITPAHNQTIWHRHPVFIWTGLTTTALGQPGQDNLWQQTLTDPSPDGVHQLAPDGDPLAPGTYYWQFSSLLVAGVWVTFEVMDDDTHAQLAVELETLESTLATDASDEAIALARMAFFAEQDLASDALHELFAVVDPSPDIQQRQAEVVEMFCADEQPEPSE